MNEWISCKNELPPVGEFVYVIKRGKLSEKVRRTETSEPYFWVFPSELRYALLEPSDEWHSIPNSGKVIITHGH